MNSKMTFGQFYPTNSWIHRLDPRTKLISLFMLMIAIFIIPNIYALLVMFLFVLILIISSKVPLLKFLSSFKMMAMLLIFTLFFQVVFNQTGERILFSLNFNMTYLNLGISIIVLILYFILQKFIHKGKLIVFLLTLFILFFIQNKLNITKVLFTYKIVVRENGLMTALKILIRIINLICLSSLLTLSTKPTDLNDGLEGVFAPLKVIGVNVSILAMMISIALRFIPTLINEANKILKAQASRGVDFSEGKLKDKLFQIISLLIPMFVIAYKRADELANAMEARAYIPGEARTKINELKYHSSDICTMIISILIFISSIVIKVIW